MHSRVFAFAPGCGDSVVKHARLHLPVRGDKKTWPKMQLKGLHGALLLHRAGATSLRLLH